MDLDKKPVTHGVAAGFTSDAITGVSRSVVRGTLTVAQSLWTLCISDFAQIIIKF